VSGLFEVALLAAVLLAASTWVVVVIAAPRSASRSGSARRRTLVGRAWLYAVVWVPPVVLLGALLPGLLGALIQWGDHCFTHGHHHHHLCLLHPPHATGDPRIWVLSVGLLVPAMLAWLGCAWRGLSLRRLARTLIATSRKTSQFEHAGVDVRVLDSDEPLALTVGFRVPTILVSSGLLTRASRSTLEVVLAHERAHVQRNDSRLAWLDRFAAALLPHAAAAPLLEQLALAREQFCDTAAAQHVGDPLLVARALTEVARLGMREPGVGVGVGMGSGALEARVLHLLEPPAPTRRAWLWPAVLLATLVLAGAGPLHGVVEHLITSLLH
jgi:Zn-dependent protease with chaperone function